MFSFFFSYLWEQMSYHLCSNFHEFFLIGITGPWFGNIFTFWYFWIYGRRSCPQRSWERSTAKVGSDCNFSFRSRSITANCLLVCAAISNLTHKWSFWSLNLDIYPVTLSLFSSICSRMLRKHGAFFLMIYWYSLLCHERIAS